jgi:hypothetical protein
MRENDLAADKPDDADQAIFPREYFEFRFASYLRVLSASPALMRG